MKPHGLILLMYSGSISNQKFAVSLILSNSIFSVFHCQFAGMAIPYNGTLPDPRGGSGYAP